MKKEGSWKRKLMRLMQNLMKKLPSKTINLMKSETRSLIRNVEVINVSKSGIRTIGMKTGVNVEDAMIETKTGVNVENGLMTVQHQMKQRKRNGGGFGNRYYSIEYNNHTKHC